jgi:immune inhibitor A
MGVSKQPSVILSVSPNPVCLGSSIAWDFTGSYAPGSTITSYSINFGDSNSDTGISGTHTYAAAGSYTITATVTEGTGLTQTVSQEVNVIDCTDLLLLAYIYASTDGSGVYYFE